MVNLTKKEIKKRHFNKVFSNAKEVFCACGCGAVIKDKDLFGRDKKYISGHNNRKYKDPLEHKRVWNRNNKVKKSEYRKRKRRERKVELVLYLGGQCLDCDLKYDGTNACLFDFHHLRDKLFGICGNMMEKSLAVLKKEADKCELLCANCHRKKSIEGEY